MGYNTEFLGELEINVSQDPYKSMNLKIIQKFLSDSFDCKWLIFDDGDQDKFYLKWDDSREKFYDYVEWIRCLINMFFLGWKWNAKGKICWHGESKKDAGIICVSDNIISIIK